MIIERLFNSLIGDCMSDYKVGYKNPPRDKQFGQPGGPPTGKTSEQRRAEIEAAELAALVSRDLTKALHDTVAAAGNDADKLALIKSDTLALLRDVQNRAHGSPKQSVDNTSSDGSMSPACLSGDVLDAIRRKHTPTSD